MTVFSKKITDHPGTVPLIFKMVDSLSNTYGSGSVGAMQVTMFYIYVFNSTLALYQVFFKF